MTPPLSPDLLIVELGERLACAACGLHLSELGATVVSIEAAGSGGPHTKGGYPATMSAGKRSMALSSDGESAARLVALIGRADAVVVSSDVDPQWPAPVQDALVRARIVCDITAFGRESGGPGLSDGLLQALSGVMDVTGDPDGPPVACRAPLLEFATANYAASAVLLALRAEAWLGLSQHVEVAIFDCAFSMLTTFLPRHFAGGVPQRIGNHHPSMSPWNSYRASDGWVMVCSGSNDQWVRVCQLIGRPDLAADPRFDTPTGRVARNPEVDDLMEAWTRSHSVAQCVRLLDTASIPCGPVVRIEDLFEEPNLRHRDMIRTVTDAATGQRVRVPGALFRGSRTRGRPAAQVSAAGHREDIDRAVAAERVIHGRPGVAGAPTGGVLAGLRVLEIGQYTTAPLCARQLGALGADVVKIEPPGGEPARILPPLRDGQGYFFTMSNSDKRGITLDLRQDADKATFAQLLAASDVVVENMKPGALTRFGFSPEELARINPRLVYCAISGFGADAPDRGRGAMDTTIQGAAGIMDLIQLDGVPYKAGISLIDLIGGQLGLLFILAALDNRDRTGQGEFIDVSMLDAAAWMTRLDWNGAATRAPSVLPCSDGYVAVEAADGSDAAIPAGLTRAEAVADLAARGIGAAPVLAVHEVVRDPRVAERGLMVKGREAGGKEWPLLASPLRLAATPCRVARAMGPLGSDAVEVLRDWGWKPPAQLTRSRAGGA